MDTRIKTFLTLCRTRNYRKTAELLYITQPAVTQQIQSLEREYEVKLFSYDGRQLTQTPEGEILERYAAAWRYSEQELRKELSGSRRIKLRIGATKTVGDYVIGEKLAACLARPEVTVELVVDNTRRLLELLEENELDFAVVEGFFDKAHYGSRLLKREKFTGICSLEHPFAGRHVSLSELFSETLFLREKGSGTRRIFEQQLEALGYYTEAFKRVSCISSFALIKEMVERKLGITFAYRSVIREGEKLAPFFISETPCSHEYNFVYLRHTEAEHYVDLFCGGEER